MTACQHGGVHEDRVRWDERHTGRPLAHPTAPEVLEEAPSLLDVLPSGGRAVDLACGTGAQSLWLAQRGFDVVALDVSPVAIGMLGEAAEVHHLTERIDARVFDAADGMPSDVTGSAVIVCQRFRDVDLYEPLVRHLRVGGILLLSVLSAADPDGPPGRFHAPPGELLHAFGDEEILHHSERAGLASIAVRRTS